MLLERLGITRPVLQGGMTFGSDGRLAAAVSGAGGLGTLGTFHYRTWEEVEAQLALIRAATDRPFAINLPFFENHVDWMRRAAEAGVKIFALGGWCNAEAAALKAEHDLTLLVSVNNPTLARSVANQPVDALIAQGNESGGANGAFTTRQLFDALRAQHPDTPIVPAGGLWDGFDLLTYRTLGAPAIQLGTRFFFCADSPLDDSIKQRVIEQGAKRPPVTQLVPVGPSLQMRFLVNKPFKTAFKRGELPELFSDKERVFDLSAAFFEPQEKSLLMYAGAGVHKLTRLETAAEVVESVVAEHDGWLERLPGPLGG